MIHAATPEGASRNDFLHGDEDWGPEFTPAEQVSIEQRASQTRAQEEAK